MMAIINKIIYIYIYRFKKKYIIINKSYNITNHAACGKTSMLYTIFEDEMIWSHQNLFISNDGNIRKN